MICSICRNPLIYSEKDCIIHINRKTGELIIKHCYCVFHLAILENEFKDYYKENIKNLKSVKND